MTDKLDPSLAEIRTLIEALTPWGDDRAATGDADAASKGGSLGMLDGLAGWLGAGQGRCPPRLERPRAAIFLGRWAADVSADAAVALDALRAGRTRVSALCRAYDAELRVYEMALDEAPAGGASRKLTQAQCAAAMAYGMTAVEEGLDLFCLTAAGPGVAQAAAALSRALRADAGSGVASPLIELARHGGHALAALAGAVIAARMARVPVILDGFGALGAGAALHCLNAAALDHCVLAQQAAGGPFLDLQQRLGKEAVIDLGIAADDGSAALVVLGLMRGALAPLA